MQRGRGWNMRVGGVGWGTFMTVEKTGWRLEWWMLALQLVRRDSVYTEQMSGLVSNGGKISLFLLQQDVRELVRQAMNAMKQALTKNNKKTNPHEIKSDCTGLDFLTYRVSLYVNWNDWIPCGFSGDIESTLTCPYWVSTSAKQQGWKPRSWIQLIQRPCNPNLSVNKSDIQSFSVHRASHAQCCFHVDPQMEHLQWQHKKLSARCSGGTYKQMGTKHKGQTPARRNNNNLIILHLDIMTSCVCLSGGCGCCKIKGCSRFLSCQNDIHGFIYTA